MLLIVNKLKKNKYFFLLKFKFIFFNYKYLSFYNFNFLNFNYKFESTIKKYNLNYLILKSNDLTSLFLTNYFTYFLKNNYILIYFNDFNNFVNYQKELQNTSNLSAMLFSGNFINHKYFNQINTYYSFYNNNFNVFIYLIINFIQLYIFIIFKFILKLLLIILKFFKLNKTN